MAGVLTVVAKIYPKMSADHVLLLRAVPDGRCLRAAPEGAAPRRAPNRDEGARGTTFSGRTPTATVSAEEEVRGREAGQA